MEELIKLIWAPEEEVGALSTPPGNCTGGGGRPPDCPPDPQPLPNGWCLG